MAYLKKSHLEYSELKKMRSAGDVRHPRSISAAKFRGAEMRACQGNDVVYKEGGFYAGGVNERRNRQKRTEIDVKGG